jgi:hypothetical protein
MAQVQPFVQRQAYRLLVDDNMSRTTPGSIISLPHRPGNLLRISLVENARESYSPQGIYEGIDLEGSALFKGKRLHNCKVIVTAVIQL